MPDSEARPPVYRRHHLAGVTGVVAGAGLFSTLLDSNLANGLFASWLIMSVLGLGFYLVFGLSGQFAFSQAAFYGLGAYSSAWASDGRSFGWGMAAAVVICAVVSLGFAVVVHRSGQFYFAIATLAFSYIATVVFREFDAFTARGGEVVGVARPSVLGHTMDNDAELVPLLLGALGVALVLVALVERSPLRREALAFHHNALVASTLGVPTMRIRLLLFVLGSTFAGAAGSLFAHRTGFVSTDAFSVALSIDVFLILLLGGISSMWGPLLGAAFVVWAPEQLRFIDEYRNIVYGVALILVMVTFPKGLVGIAEAAWRRLGPVLRRRRSGARG